MRYVPWAKLRKDENDNVLGILGTAFRLRHDEKALSTTWHEYFEGDRHDQLIAAVRAIRESNLSPGGKSGFAIGNVGAITAACANRSYSIRIVHEPMDDNKAHAAVRRLPRDDLQLLELLAAETWAELILNSSVPSDSKSAQ